MGVHEAGHEAHHSERLVVVDDLDVARVVNKDILGVAVALRRQHIPQRGRGNGGAVEPLLQQVDREAPVPAPVERVQRDAARLLHGEAVPVDVQAAAARQDGADLGQPDAGREGLRSAQMAQAGGRPEVGVV
eukprot:365193-Chlamydomonas_euryale.AAC.17